MEQSPVDHQGIIGFIKLGFICPHFYLCGSKLGLRIGQLLLLAFQSLVSSLNLIHGRQIALNLGHLLLQCRQLLLQLGKGGVILRQSFNLCLQRINLALHRRLTGNCLVIRRLQLGILLIQLVFCCFDHRFCFCFFRCQLLFGSSNLSTGNFDLLSAFFDFPSGVNQLLTIVLQLLLCVFQLSFRIGQFLFGFRLSVFVFFQTVQVFLIAFIIFFFRFCFHFGKTFFCQPLCLRFQGVYGSIQGVIVLVSVDFIVTGDGQIDFGKIVHIEGALGNVIVVFQTAAAYRGGTPVHIHVQRCGNTSNNGEGLIAQAIHRIFVIIGRQRDSLPQHVLSPVESICQTFVIRLRHPTAAQGNLIDILGNGIEAVYAIFPILAGFCDQIHPDRAFSLGDTLQLLYLVHILLSPAIAADQTDVEHILLVGKILPRGNHVGFGHQKADKQPRAQSDDRGNGSISSEGLDNGLAQIPAHGISFHHHSISAMFCGCSFCVTEKTVPFLTRITRSAIAVKALLWVMMITVIPVLRPVSCSSCKMALPV